MTPKYVLKAWYDTANPQPHDVPVLSMSIVQGRNRRWVAHVQSEWLKTETFTSVGMTLKDAMIAAMRLFLENAEEAEREHEAGP